MKLAIMTKSTFFVEEDKILSALFDVGLDNLHLYKPETSPIYSERLLSLLPDKSYEKIFVHSHYYLKDEYRLAGIHLDKDTDEIPDGYKGKIGRTCRDLSKLKELKKQSAYVFLGNIFKSQSEPSEPGTFTMSQLEEASDKGLIDKHVYALGGMNAENISVARELGFGGVVIRGDLWNKFNIHNQMDYKELITYFEKLRKLIY